MAFRRRRFNRGLRGRFGRPFARQGTTWVTTLFNEVATAAAVVGEMVLLDALDVDPTVTVGNAGNQVYHVKRIIFNGVVMAVPAISGGNVDVHSLVWGIYTVDTEDSDDQLNSTAASSLLRTERILQSGVVGFGAQAAFANVQGGHINTGARIEVDLRTPVKMRADEVLVFGIQQMSSAGSAFAVQPAVSAISRILVLQP